MRSRERSKLYRILHRLVPTSDRVLWWYTKIYSVNILSPRSEGNAEKWDSRRHGGS